MNSGLIKVDIHSNRKLSLINNGINWWFGRCYDFNEVFLGKAKHRPMIILLDSTELPSEPLAQTKRIIIIIIIKSLKCQIPDFHSAVSEYI